MTGASEEDPYQRKGNYIPDSLKGSNMKKTYKLIYSYDDGSTDEYYYKAHNTTTAKEKLLPLLKSDEKPIKLCEMVKGKGWRELSI